MAVFTMGAARYDRFCPQAAADEFRQRAGCAPESQGLRRTPPAGLSAMRGMPRNRLNFQVNFFYHEDFVYLYDELFTLGKIFS
jgi:hypothetical protein